ncbi:tail fiber protein [Paenibacillus macquariensis]|uniref:Phage tail fibre repeat-containing protein n=1 Tax=Paenibacillus macquariensis TaxID=948756 RepID=A0ABY1JXD7_9BACL|nr:phage tail protein [Paenibacillus macquariensis]MEC0089320.1 phage tail protein [Paenibacillus macquariensis]OAB33278.1 hypothetical protein PMSM_14795 [Paenibacillus macquariensis subsp. macquariensis]SIQ93878.1 Phage tail fibre repeat-containing protein [Paenibacillus macquariensis]
MSSVTPNLGLLKKDPTTERNDTFNIKTMMNDNWDKIDQAVGEIREEVQDIVIPDASLTVKGITKLNSAVNSTSETEAATPKAIKTVNDALVLHKADYVNHPAVVDTTNVGNTYSVTLPSLTAYKHGMGIVATINADSTGAATIQANALGEIPLRNAQGSAISNLKKDGVYTFRYSAPKAAFILQGEGVDTAPLITSINGILGS